MRSLLKALEARSHGFSNGHRKTHGESRMKAIDLVMLFPVHDPHVASNGATWPTSRTVTTWRNLALGRTSESASHRRDHEAVRLGCCFRRAVWLKRPPRKCRCCRLDGSQEAAGTRREDEQIVGALAPAHELLEKDAAAAEGELCGARAKVCR